MIQKEGMQRSINSTPAVTKLKKSRPFLRVASNRLQFWEQQSPNKTTETHIGSICSVCCGKLNKLHMGRLQRWWSLVTLGCTQALKGIGPLVYNEGNHQLKSPNFVENRPIFAIEISYPNNLFFTKSFCRLHTYFKNISWFSQWYYGSHFYGRV